LGESDLDGDVSYNSSSTMEQEEKVQRQKNPLILQLERGADPRK